MNSGLKKMTAVFAAGVMLSGTGTVLCVPTAAVDEAELVVGELDGLSYIQYGEDGSLGIDKCDPSLSDVTIPDRIDGLPVAYICPDAFADCTALKTVTFPDSVIRIESDAFENCTSLTSVALPSGLKQIGQKAFYGCEQLSEIIIPDSLMEIGYDAFAGTPWLAEQLADSAFAVANGIVFDADPAQCTGNITFPDGIVCIDDGAFRDCEDITSVDVPESVIRIGKNAFYGCRCMTEIRIPEGVEKIEGGAFSYCEGLTSVALPASMAFLHEGAFYICKNLTSINVAEANKSYCTVDGAVLSRDGKRLMICPGGRTEFTVPAGVKFIGDKAFSYNENLTGVTLPEGLKDIGFFAFSECTALTSVDIPEGVESIENMAFSGCKGLTEIRLPQSVAHIWQYAFYGCDALADVYYAGTEAQWDTVLIELKNDGLENATIHFGSAAFVLGDINADGEINALDAALILAESALTGAGQQGQFTDAQKAAAEINGDGEINAADAAIILAYSAAAGAGQENVTLQDFVQ